VQACLAGVDGARLQVFGPENGIVDGVVHQALERVLPPEASRHAIRSQLGDSGLAGGFALAAGLLAGQGNASIITISSSRGGVQAATLVERIAGR
jgi:hypothetical protein